MVWPCKGVILGLTTFRQVLKAFDNGSIPGFECTTYWRSSTQACYQLRVLWTYKFIHEQQLVFNYRKITVVIFWPYLSLVWRLTESSSFAIRHFFLISLSFLWLLSMTRSCFLWLAHRSGNTELSLRFPALFWFCTKPCTNQAEEIYKKISLYTCRDKKRRKKKEIRPRAVKWVCSSFFNSSQLGKKRFCFS